MDAARSAVDRLAGIFGHDNVYVELQRHFHRDQEERNRAAIEIARSLHLPLLATNGVCYAIPREREVCDVFTALRHHLTLATAGRLTRLTLLPLSPDSVATLALPHGVDADELYRKTAGNPFFVVEALAAVEHELPETVRDAVLARAARLSPAARHLLVSSRGTHPNILRYLLGAGSALHPCDTSSQTASTRRNPFHTAVPAPDSSTRTKRGCWYSPLRLMRGSAVRCSRCSG